MAIRETLLGWNRATNRLFMRLTQRPQHFDLYKRLVGEAAARSRAIVHLGAGTVWLGDICPVPLGGKVVYAVEPDSETLASNPAEHRILAGGEKIPLESESVDAIVCEYVVEHLTEPELVLREAWRLLRPGGRFVFVTPNFLSYSGMITWLTPQWLHEKFLSRLMAIGGSANEKPYKTAFRMNTRWAIHRLARTTGFVMRSLDSGVDFPTYTYPFPLVHQIAVLWHIALDRIEWMEPLRITWIGVLEKPSEPNADRIVESDLPDRG